ncbi:MAG: monovalent cation/hydrogen antiporter [Thermoleophilaceae bacterium]|nr:monovalent cation/hydrogen antiporter [Thermoleophilaceae bacterium]
MSDPIQVAETIVLLLAIALALAWVSRRVAVPYPVALVLGGVGLAFVPGLPPIRLDGDLVLLLFVAPLLYADAFFAPLNELRRNARSIALLSSALVVVTAAAVAVAAHYALDLPWATAAVLGGALAATDAVAPVQVLGREGADPRLVAVVQGESLLNDGVALTLVKVASAAAVTGSFSLLGAGGEFLWTVAGGVAAGVAVAAVVAEARKRTEDTIIEAALSLVTPFASYIAADRLGASGILAAVAAGLWMGRRKHDVIEPLTRVELRAAWQIIGFVLNSLLFLLVGLQMDNIVSAVSLPVGQIALGTAAVLVALMGIRIVWALLLPSAWQSARGLVGRAEPLSTKGWRFALAWSGVRGSVALAAVLSLPRTVDGGDPFPGRDLVLLMTLIVIVATLVAQGLTLRPLLRRLDLTDPEAVEREDAVARERAAQAALSQLTAAAERYDLPEENREWLEREYAFRSRQYGARADHGGDDDLEDRKRRVAAADSVLLEAARAAVMELAARGEIRAEVAQEVLRDLDLDNARISDPEKTGPG